MDVRNCKRCGRLFDYAGMPVCPECNKEMEEKFVDVKKYIEEHPRVNLSAISEDMEIPMQQIKKWIREERLSFTKDSGITISCEKCGLPILTGRFCKECKQHMSDSLSDLYQKKEEPVKKKPQDSGAKMRFLN